MREFRDWLLRALAEQKAGDYLAWSVMLGMLGVIAVTISRQHRRILPHLDDASPEMQHNLFQLARSRGWVLCFLWALLTLTVIITGLQHPSGETMPLEPAAIAPASASMPAAPLVRHSPEAAAVMAQVPAMARDALIDRIKLYYEDAFVSYYYLNKCNVARKEDNQTLYHALLTELTTQNAEGDARKVIDAASGSFEVIYSESSCDAAVVSPVARDFKALMEGLPARLSAQK